MKKILPVLGAVLISGASIAQTSNSQQNVKLWSLEAMSKKASGNNVSNHINSLKPKQNFFVENFDGGTFPPTGWTVQSGPASTITVPAEQAWHLDPTGGNPDGCAQVLYTNSVDTHDEWLIMPSQDFSSLTPGTNLRMTWEFSTSQYWHVTPNDNVDITLEVSLDGGANFTQVIFQEDDAALLANSLLDLNWETYTWTPALTDISSLVGEADVVFAWHYSGIDGAQFNLDNISIDDVADIDLSLKHMFNTDWENDYEYSMIPLIETRPLAVSAAIQNIGATVLSNVGFDYDIALQGGSSVASGSSAMTIASQAIGSKDTVYEVSSYTPSAEGIFDMTLTVTTTSGTDAVASNNSGARMVEITDTVWGVDNDAIEYVISAAGFGTETYPFEVGNSFVTSSRGGTMASSISFVMAPDSTQNIGETVYGVIKTWDGTSWIEVARTDDYTLTANDLGVLITLPIASPTANVLLSASTGYRVLAGCYGGSEDLDFALGGQAVDGGVCINVWDDANSVQADYVWSSPEYAPIVRLNVADAVAASVEEVTSNVTVGQNYPNPFNGNTTVNYSLVNVDEVTVEITDVTGKVIAVINEGVKAAGSHSVVLNSKDLAAGTYYYSVVTSNGKVTKAMTVAK